MKIFELLQYLETIAPPALQENYDNAGLLVGDKEAEISGVLITLDCIEKTIEEAVSKKCNLIIAHHPVIFSGLKKITGSTYVERTILTAIKNTIAIYAIHTNLDNVLPGVNKKIAEKLGLQDCKILQPKKNIFKKLVTFIPHDHVEKVRTALFDAGGGAIGNYDHCSFNITGTGTFRGNDETQAFVGEKNIEHHEPETRVEIIFPSWMEKQLLNALLKNHPYEEVAYDIYPLENSYKEAGAGLIGKLASPLPEIDFLLHVKDTMKTSVIRHTTLLEKPVQSVAVCGGAGSFLLQDAIAAGAEVFITSDFKYHQFFDAENKILIADIGHYESEQFTVDLLTGIIQQKFPNFAPPIIKGANTNPVKYL
ncbi:MAG: Nif3-like dinuclear metal center hexameric protein [Chitinophagales bacterium]